MLMEALQFREEDFFVLFNNECLKENVDQVKNMLQLNYEDYLSLENSITPAIDKENNKLCPSEASFRVNLS